MTERSNLPPPAPIAPQADKDLAKAYATIAAGYHRELPLLARNLREAFHNEITQLRVDVASGFAKLNTKIEALQDRPRRSMSPMPQSSDRFDPEQTQNGSRKFSPSQWAEFQKALREQGEKLEELSEARDRAEAEKVGAQKALEDLEKDAAKAEAIADKRRKNVTTALAVLAAAGSFLTWLFTHSYHL